MERHVLSLIPLKWMVGVGYTTGSLFLSGAESANLLMEVPLVQCPTFLHGLPPSLLPVSLVSCMR